MSHFQIEDTFVDVPGGSTFVRKWTPDNDSPRPPVILLHDSLGCVDLWRDFPEALARCLDRSVIAYDRLGFGKSTARVGLPSVNFIVDEADVFFPAIRRALDLSRFSLFGHSVGGAMALMIAASADSGCYSVITESAQVFVEQRTLAGILAAKEQFNHSEQFNKLTKRHGDKARWVLDAWTETWLSEAFSAWSLEPHLHKVHCPVLAVHGDLDEYGSTEFPHRIVSGVNGPAELAILKGCGHVPHREQQEQVLQLASRFIAKSSSSLAQRTR